MDWRCAGYVPPQSLHRDQTEPEPMKSLLRDLTEPVPTSLDPTHFIYPQNYNQQPIINHQPYQYFSSHYQQISPFEHSREDINQIVDDFVNEFVSEKPIDDSVNELLCVDEVDTVDSLMINLDESELKLLSSDNVCEHIEETVQKINEEHRQGVKGRPSVVNIFADEWIPESVPVPGLAVSKITTTPWLQQQLQHQLSTAAATHCTEKPFIDQYDQSVGPLHHCLEGRERLLTDPTTQAHPATPPRKIYSNKTHKNRSSRHQELTKEQLEKKRRNTESYKRSIAKRKRIEEENELSLIREQKRNVAYKAQLDLLQTKIGEIIDKIIRKSYGGLSDAYITSIVDRTIEFYFGITTLSNRVNSSYVGAMSI